MPLVDLLTNKTRTVDGTVDVGNFPVSQAVTGPLTDTQLRATAVPVSGPLTDTQLRTTAVPVSGPLTDTELRLADVKITLDGETVAVTGPLTDTQLRTTPVKVSPDDYGEYGIHICTDNVQATTGYVLVDKSDTVNFPHSVDGDIYLTGYQISINPDNSFLGQVLIGFISRVDATNGHFRPTLCWYFTRGAANLSNSMDFAFDPMKLHTDNFLVAGNDADTTFQTDVALTAPSGTAAPGVGDCVMKIVRTAGAVSVGITVKYFTKA